MTFDEVADEWTTKPLDLVQDSSISRRAGEDDSKNQERSESKATAGSGLRKRTVRKGVFFPDEKNDWEEYCTMYRNGGRSTNFIQ